MCESLANGNGEDAPQATIIPIAVKPTVPRAKEGETKAEKATREEAEFYKPHPWDVSVVVLPPGVKGGKGVSHMAIEQRRGLQ
jgi:hypothetical protein